MTHPVLPKNQSALSADMMEISERLLDLDIDIALANDPDAIPAEFLPYLAYGESVDLWIDEWDESTRRQAVKSAFDLHRYKGTPYAIRRYVEQAGGEVRHFERPPAIAHVGRDFTDVERTAWLAHYPQLRVYPYRGHAKLPFQFFSRSSHPGVSQGPKRRFAMPTGAPARAGRRAVINDKGVETDLNVTVTARLQNDEVLVERELIHLKVFKPFGLAAGYLRHPRRFAGTRGTMKNTVTLSASQPFGASTLDRVRQIVSPGLTPIDPTPVERNERWTPPKGKFFVGQGLKRFVAHSSFAYPSTSFLRIYDVVWLYRPGINITPRRGRFFAGITRLGMPSYTSEVRVKLRRKSAASKLYAGGFAKVSHTYPLDTVLLENTLRGIRSAKSLRDQIDLNINCTDIVRASPRLLAGDVVCGEQMETI